MSRKIQVSHPVSSHIERLQKCPGLLYGLVIGHVSGKELMVVHLARTPSEENDRPKEEGQENVAKISEIDSGWVAEHVKQARAMLPGGMDVQGLFFVSEEDIFKKHNAIVLSCLKQVKEQVKADDSSLWPVFHISSKSIVLKSISISDPAKSKVNSYEVADLQWLCLKANLILDQPLAFTEEKTDCPLNEKLEAAVKKLEISLNEATMLLNGQFRKNSDLLYAKSSKKETGSKGKKGKKGQYKDDSTATEASCDENLDEPGYKSIKDFEVDILFADSCSSLDDCVISEVKAKMQIMGRMCARAFVHQNATVEQAIKALKEDILRTFKGRLDMHCDSLVGDEMRGTDDELPILHEPPRRVNIKLPQSPITVSDFLFPGETQDESVKAVEEMLGFIPNFEHLDDELEIVASPQQKARMEGESRAESPVLEKRRAHNTCSPFNIILSVIVALAAIGGSYLFTMTNNESEIPETPMDDIDLK